MPGKVPPCPTCGKIPALTNGEEIYPARPGLWVKAFYICRPCSAYVGCHVNTTKPLGVVAGPELRRLRQEAHETFDQLWRGQPKHVRESCYAWLAAKLGIAVRNCHIGMFDEERCRRVIQIVKERN